MTKSRRPKSQPRIRSEPVEVPIKPSCPQGYTRQDLGYIFSEEGLAEFYAWMVGQTCSICDGRTYVYKRTHSNACGHPADQETFTWDCEYEPGGHYAATECSRLPAGTIIDKNAILTGHGTITYRFDVERFIEGGYKKDIFD